MYTEILLDKPRRLRFDIPALRDLETAMGGKPIGQIVGELQQVGVTAIVTALWAGLRHDDRTLTIARVTALLETHLENAPLGSIHDVMRQIDTALRASTVLRGADAEVAEGNGRPEPVTT